MSPLTFRSSRSTLSSQCFNLLSVILPVQTENYQNSLLRFWTVASDILFGSQMKGVLKQPLYYRHHNLIYRMTRLSFLWYCWWQWLFVFGSHCFPITGYITQILVFSEGEIENCSLASQKLYSVLLDLNLLFFSLFGRPPKLTESSWVNMKFIALGFFTFQLAGK